MKNLKFAGIASIVIILFTSCVSSKKYNDAMSAKEKAKADQLVETSRLNAENNAMREQNKNLTTENNILRSEKTQINEAKKAGDVKALLVEKRQAIDMLKQKVAIALQDFDRNEVQINVSNGRLYVSMSDEFLFHSGSKAQKERGNTAVLRLAEVIPAKDYDIAVVGHTDSILPHKASHKENWGLSLQRASSVALVFIEKGTPTENIFVTGETKYHVIDSNETKEGRQLNGRTVIVLTPKLDDVWKLTEEAEVEKLNK